MGRVPLFLFLAASSVSDLRFRKVSNGLIILFYISGIFLSLMEKGIAAAAEGVFLSLIIFAVLFIFWAGHLIGAGDVKFLMTVSLFTGWEILKRSLLPVTAISVLTAAVMALRERKIRHLEIPMTVPVSIGILSSL